MELKNEYFYTPDIKTTERIFMQTKDLEDESISGDFITNTYEDNENDKSIEIPKEDRKLRIQSYDNRVNDIFNMIKDKDILLDPDYQRNYIWDNKKASLLIESILLNVPIPVIYCEEEEDGKWNVVDGLQRLNSIFRFFCDDLKLTGLEVLTELNGTRYSDMKDQKAGRVLRNGTIRIIVIFNDSHPEIKYDIFMRLNRGSIQLNEQELRNFLYRGTFNEFLKNLRYNNKFLKIMNLSEPHKRMVDIELILRFFALKEDYNIENNSFSKYKGVMKTYLNEFMNRNKNYNSNQEIIFKNMFNTTIDKVFSIFGENAFRKINTDKSFDKILNRAIMDIIMLSFSKYKLETLESKKKEIIDMFYSLCFYEGSSEFLDSLTKGTSDIRQMKTRLKIWFHNLKSLLGEFDESF